MRPEVAKKARDRLARLEGQIRGVAKMIERDEYCIDVITQLGSIGSAIEGLGLLLLDDHVRTCVVEAEDPTEKVDELMAALKRFVRS